MTNRKPSKALTLTIVIPVYNDEHHLKACLDSIAKQSVKPEKVIVVDNNSKDNSAQVASSYSFVTIIREKKQGVVFARDKGFNAVKTSLIGRIDSDSVLPPHWVKTIKDFYRDPNKLNEAFTGGCYFYNIRAPRFMSWWQDQVAFRYNRFLMGHYILFGSNMAITSDQWDKVKGLVCNDTDVHEDLDLAIHLHRIGYEITYNANFRVGVVMRRVRSNRKELWSNIMWWPKTLRRHGKKTWIFGWLGAAFFFVISPTVSIAEGFSQLIGKPPLDD